MDSDTNNVTPAALVTKLKSQGFFDKVRKKCLGMVDNRRDYNNLMSEVERFVSRFLQRQPFPPKLSKIDLRERLRRELCATSFLQRSVSLLVQSVLDQQPAESLQSPINSVVCDSMGVNLQSWLERKDTKIKVQLSVPPPPGLLSAVPMPFSGPTASMTATSTTTSVSSNSTHPPISSLTSPTVVPVSLFAFPNISLCQPPPILGTPLTSVPGTQSSFFVPQVDSSAIPLSLANTLTENFQPKSLALLKAPLLSLKPLPHTKNESCSDSNSVGADEDQLQCDDSMDLESSSSRNSIIDKSGKDDNAQDANVSLDAADSGDLCIQRLNSSSFSRQVLWQGVKMELDDISDEDTEVNKLSSREAFSEDVHSTNQSRMSPLRLRLSSGQPSKRSSPPNYQRASGTLQTIGTKARPDFASNSDRYSRSRYHSSERSPTLRIQNDRDHLHKNPSPNSDLYNSGSRFSDANRFCNRRHPSGDMPGRVSSRFHHVQSNQSRFQHDKGPRTNAKNHVYSKRFDSPTHQRSRTGREDRNQLNSNITPQKCNPRARPKGKEFSHQSRSRVYVTKNWNRSRDPISSSISRSHSRSRSVSFHESTGPLSRSPRSKPGMQQYRPSGFRTLRDTSSPICSSSAKQRGYNSVSPGPRVAAFAMTASHPRRQRQDSPHMILNGPQDKPNPEGRSGTAISGRFLGSASPSSSDRETKRLNHSRGNYDSRTSKRQQY